MSLFEDIKRLKAIKKQCTAKKPEVSPANKEAQQLAKKRNIKIQKELESSLNNLDNVDQKPMKVRPQEQKSEQNPFKPEFLSNQQLQRTQKKISPKIPSSKQQKQQKIQIPNDLFKGLKFCFPIFNAELSKQRAYNIQKNTIQPYQGKVIELTDLLDEANWINGQKEQKDDEGKQENEMDQYPFVNYFLIDKNIKRENLQKLIGAKIGYEEILDVNYIFDCLKVGKVLQTDFYIIKSKDQQFYNEHIEKMKENLKGEDKTLSNQFTSFFTNPNSASKQATGQDANEKKNSFNQFIADSFERLKQMYEKSDRGRAFAYGRAASIVKSLNRNITCEADVDKLQGHRFLGKKTLTKIKEMITTGSLERLNMMSGKQVNQACGKLAKIWGIGKQSANQLYNRGIKSVEQLRQAFDKGQVTLTKNQKLGLKYCDDLQIRINRDKVTRMFQFVKKVFVQLVGTDQLHKIQVAGSYRRNRPTCGDIDILITRIDGRWEKTIVNDLVDRLVQLKFLTDHLTMPRHVDPKSCTSYMGICQFQDEVHHRIDIKYYPPEQYAYAILYFTGSGEFNRLMRLHALRKGYRLSDHGMSKAQRVSATKMAVYGPQIVCMTQQQIFAFLQFQYKTPEQRCL